MAHGTLLFFAVCLQQGSVLDIRDSGAPVAVCKDTLLVFRPPLGPDHAPEPGISGAAFSFPGMLSASYWQTTVSMCACKPAFASVMQGGVILPCHPPCCSVQLLLRQSLYAHVQRGDARMGTGLGQQLLTSPLSICRQGSWRNPSCSEALLVTHPPEAGPSPLPNSGRRGRRGPHWVCT